MDTVWAKWVLKVCLTSSKNVRRIYFKSNFISKKVRKKSWILVKSSIRELCDSDLSRLCNFDKLAISLFRNIWYNQNGTVCVKRWLWVLWPSMRSKNPICSNKWQSGIVGSINTNDNSYGDTLPCDYLGIIGIITNWYGKGSVATSKLSLLHSKTPHFN